MQTAQTQRIEQDLKQYSFPLYQGALVAFQRDTKQAQSPELLGQEKIKVTLDVKGIWRHDPIIITIRVIYWWRNEPQIKSNTINRKITRKWYMS